ncbi:efflux transporter outer membrane subunit [Phycisphaerales bacterium AB-hyl4]|uniref:Efflux transporter outer membrane subunit n=1 Tax=Natronomicrosphaera hydrolytica TaxID=3242702 RepID=A0ABV4UA34_9BACT
MNMQNFQTNWMTHLITVTATVMVGGCTVGPDYESPTIDMPATWGSLSDEAVVDDHAVIPTSESKSLATWWLAFEDETLSALIERAVRTNLDLHVAQVRVREARARRGIASADLLPTVFGGGAYTRSRTSANAYDDPTAGTEASLYQAGFDAIWEVDVFGGVRRNVEAAAADIAASIEDRRDVLVTLLAEVAQNYAELRSYQRRIAIAQANLEGQRETLAITRMRLDAGLVSDLDVTRARAQVRTTESQIPALESAARQSIHALSVLLAEPPTTLVAALSMSRPMLAAPDDVPVGLPSELLRRRPDIRRAERELASITARVGVATAELFPRFSLTGSLGLSSSQFSDLGDYGSRFWSFGPSVSWPVFDFGRIRSNIDVQSAREEQALLRYEQVVLTSLREVEDALVAFTKEQSRRVALASAVDDNRRAAELADELYQQGLTDFLSVLQSQRDLLISEDALVQSDRAVVTQLVSLYKALGGGWEAETMVY